MFSRFFVRRPVFAWVIAIYVNGLMKTISYSKNNKLGWWSVVVITG